MTRLNARLRRSEEGFTLIELLVVVAIIALLATFAVPRLFDAINKSKKAPGQADLQTISSALERYYMDTNRYPGGTDAVIMGALRNGYLKSGTTFRNGFKQGYLYVTSANGAGYFLVDLQGQAPGATVSVTCTDGTTPVNVVITVESGDTADLSVNTATAVTDAQIQSCALTTANPNIATVSH